ncbi:DNA cytosine methyltransferase [Amycolatopsis sp. ATCC 39116]|uniref:DNA cytosine methyltransferase n=1 Tax=Amycolatopsis sp. (strain ATCC 39116 / 75iv2) TaxID=385957 RepID=UPI000262656A|nr:DNA cytosine methyltransferase [Amycolatopsis sp. ATCC 39116]
MYTIKDLFSGAGGSALGATVVPGVKLILAANHDPRAIETHALNFPDCEHDCADISQVEPRRYRRTNILWASPECTNHSIAKGRKRASAQPSLFDDVAPDPAAERSRATMWDVPRFAEVHRYEAVIVENVVDAAKWEPFRAWLMAMDSFGYDHHIVSLNSMHAPAIAAPRAPQSRDRMYVVFWRKGNPAPNLDIRPTAWCPTCDREVRAIQAWKGTARVGRYRQQYVYRCPSATCRNQIVEPYVLPAAAAIDWSVPGQRIGDRDKPLSEKTMARIRAGLARYAVPQLVTAGGSWNDTSYPTSDPFRTRTTREAEGLLVPLEGREGKEARSTREAFRTQTTRHQDALVVPYYGTADHAHPVNRPVGALTTRDRYGVAFIAELRGGGSDARHVREPLATVCASGNHHMLVRHNTARGDSGYLSTPVTEPARTLTTAGHQSLVGWPRETPEVEDCTFRMLTVAEIQAAMAFTPDYVITGTKREQVRQLGNGVTPPAAEWLVRSVVASLDTTVHDTLEAA